jgi:hypothetical protein
LALKGSCESAARLFGAGEELRESIGASVLPFYRADYDRGTAEVAAALPAEMAAAAWAEGKRMTLREAVAYALAEC